jgi:RHS repeat-associated protein
MDRFVYNYHTLGGQPSNRLNYVADNGTDYSAYDDIKSGQTTGNYTYNKIGELIEDASEDMELEWRTGDHKLLRVIRTDDASPNLTFFYNPFGQRIMKIAAERANGNPTGQHISTFYSYDANGQVMAVYEINWQEDTYKLKERHIYGAERLGINSTEVPIYENNAFTSFTHKEENIVHTDERGHKRYELTNHLGNVLAVINDRKIWNATESNYEPVMLSWSDFYAFGMQMPGRNGGADYRYLFNGMEHDGEVSGNGNSYTTEFRQYDPRLGRWKSLDPLMAKFPHSSPYVAFNNNPVYYVDPLGLEGTNPDGEPNVGYVCTEEETGKTLMYAGDGRWIDDIQIEKAINNISGVIYNVVKDYAPLKVKKTLLAGQGKPIAPWMEIAKAEIGVTESNDPKNPGYQRVKEYYKNGAGQGGLHPTDNAWCSSFANWCIKLASENNNNKYSFIPLNGNTNNPALAINWINRSRYPGGKNLIP